MTTSSLSSVALNLLLKLMHNICGTAKPSRKIFFDRADKVETKPLCAELNLNQHHFQNDANGIK